MSGSPAILEVTTVSDTEAVVHAVDDEGRVSVHRFDELEPDTTTRVPISVDGATTHVDVTTLARPEGELLSRFATVNDLHFGELAAGQVDDLPDGPIRRAEPGAEPYPEVMNRTAVAEIAGIDPDRVIVKGDLSLDGADEEFEAFEACFRPAFGDRLVVTRGNHDAYRHQDRYAGDRRVDLDGVIVALLDTTIPGATTGDLTAEQTEWLDEVAASADRPVIAMGHHQQWIPDLSGDATERRSDDYFGLHPDASDRLDEVCARRTSILAYAAGHTHRHRRRTMRASGVPTIEVGCTKDFPGSWAEYRVFEGGVMQVVHRMSSAEALEWSESCRGLYADFGVDYATYALGALGDRCLIIPLRDDR